MVFTTRRMDRNEKNRSNFTEICKRFHRNAKKQHRYVLVSERSTT